MTTITIERSFLIRVLEQLDVAQSLLERSRHHAKMLSVYEDLRAALSSPATAPEQPDAEVTIQHFRGLKSMENIDWTLYTDLPPGTHKLYLHPPATAPEQCWCDEQGIGEPGVSCGDCPTRDYKTTAPEQPAWHDAPTEPGTWVLSLSSGMEVQENITQHEIDIETAWPGCRWYGPIPLDSGDKP